MTKSRDTIAGQGVEGRKGLRRKSENKFENRADDIRKHETKSENKIENRTAEIKKTDAKKIRKPDGQYQKTRRAISENRAVEYQKQDKRKTKRATAMAGPARPHSKTEG